MDFPKRLRVAVENLEPAVESTCEDNSCRMHLDLGSSRSGDDGRVPIDLGPGKTCDDIGLGFSRANDDGGVPIDVGPGKTCDDDGCRTPIHLGSGTAGDDGRAPIELGPGKTTMALGSGGLLVGTEQPSSPSLYTYPYAHPPDPFCENNKMSSLSQLKLTVGDQRRGRRRRERAVRTERRQIRSLRERIQIMQANVAVQASEIHYKIPRFGLLRLGKRPARSSSALDGRAVRVNGGGGVQQDMRWARTSDVVMTSRTRYGVPRCELVKATKRAKKADTSDKGGGLSNRPVRMKRYVYLHPSYSNKL